jgi:hypothetical protein
LERRLHVCQVCQNLVVIDVQDFVVQRHVSKHNQQPCCGGMNLPTAISGFVPISIYVSAATANFAVFGFCWKKFRCCWKTSKRDNLAQVEQWHDKKHPGQSSIFTEFFETILYSKKLPRHDSFGARIDEQATGRGFNVSNAFVPKCQPNCAYASSVLTTLAPSHVTAPQ